MRLNEKELSIFLNLLEHATDDETELILSPAEYKEIIAKLKKHKIKKPAIHYYWFDEKFESSNKVWLTAPCGFYISPEYNNWETKTKWDKSGICTKTIEDVTCMRCREWLHLPVEKIAKEKEEKIDRLITLEL